MSNFDLISFIQNNISSVVTSAQVIATGVIGAIFFRRKACVETQTRELEKIKAGKLEAVLEEMLNEGNISYMELLKTKNYLDIAKKADEYIQSKDIMEHPEKQDFDWHIRFFENCGSVGNEEMQDYWAKILAGEIIQPGSYSLRTIECLKTLSRDEAKLFQKICNASYDMGKSVVLPQFKSIFQEFEITYGDILRIEDCGLIKSDNWINGEFSVREEYHTITKNDEQALLVKLAEGAIPNDNNNIVIQEYLFTQSGEELYKMIKPLPNIEFLYKELKELYPQYHFCIGKIIQKVGDELLIDDDED